jgi:hypothetical protein
MRAHHRHVGIALGLLLAGLLCLSGCESGGNFSLFGYTTQPPFDCNIRTVYVPIAQNTTYMRGIEQELTKAEIGRAHV